MDLLYYLCPSAPAAGSSGQHTKMLVTGAYYLGVCLLALCISAAAIILPERTNRRKGQRPLEYICRLPIWPDISVTMAAIILAVGVTMPTWIDPAGLSVIKFVPVFILPLLSILVAVRVRLARPCIRLTAEAIHFDAKDLCRQRYRPIVPFGDVLSVENLPNYYRIKLRSGHPISINKRAITAYQGYNYVEDALKSIPAPAYPHVQKTAELLP